jgi:hypothetical protein
MPLNFQRPKRIQAKPKKQLSTQLPHDSAANNARLQVQNKIAGTPMQMGFH